MRIMVWLKRSVEKIVKLIPAEERKKLWVCIKIGRYHIYLPKMLKPKAVKLINLWKIFYTQSDINKIQNLD